MYLENYGVYAELVKNGTMDVYTKKINSSNIEDHYNWVLNILKDGIEQPKIQQLKVMINFTDKVVIPQHIANYLINLIFWSMITRVSPNISSVYYFDTILDPITKGTIANYVNIHVVRPNIRTIDMIRLNQIIDNGIGKFRDLENYQMYLANTVNLRDTDLLRRKYPEFDKALHVDISNIPMEDIKDEGLKAAKIQVEYIKNSDHCLKYAFIAGQGINIKQYKEVSASIGTKPDGAGGIFPHAINSSFINGGLATVEDFVVESSIGRQAQILQKQNVSECGAFARALGLNNQDSKLHIDPDYACDTKNYLRVEIANRDILDEYDRRYYRTTPNGVDKLIDAYTDDFLIGQTIYIRSPMTCASAARGDGVCYKCYGDLAYIIRDTNIGQYASEDLSSVYTQTQLSAKHLLESAIVRMEWTKGFYDVFSVDYNQIILKDEFDYRGYRILVDEPLDDEDEDGDDALFDADKMYVTSFDVVYPDGHIVTMKSSNSEAESDEIYIHQELLDYMNNIGTNDDGLYEIELSKIRNISALFEFNVKNDELSKTMKTIKNIINNKKLTKSFDIHSILREFVMTNLQGGIKINSVHFEILLMNQIRAYDDELELPDWSHEGELCQILTLNEALMNNLSISVRLQASKISRTLTHPNIGRLRKASNMDPFYMEQPQKFTTNEYRASTYKMHDDIDKKIITPMYYVDKSIRDEFEKRN